MAPSTPDPAVAAAARDDNPRGLTVRDVALQLRVSPSTIRAWEERYQLTDPARTPGGHRRYRLADRRRLLIMGFELAKGRRPAEAAVLAKADPWRRDLQPRASIVRFMHAARHGDGPAMRAELDRARAAFGVETTFSWFAPNAIRETSIASRLGLCRPADVWRAIDVTMAWVTRATAPGQTNHGPGLLAVVGARHREVEGDCLIGIVRARGWDVHRVQRPTSARWVHSAIEEHGSRAVLVVAESPAERRPVIELLRDLGAVTPYPVGYTGGGFVSARVRRDARGVYLGEDLIQAADELVALLSRES
jgi:DNA-binding transcriptional MerR regulator